MLDTLIIFGAKYLYLVVVALTLYYFYKLSHSQRKSFIILAIISLPLIFLVSRLTSQFYFDPRPFVVGNFTPLVPHAADNGFPSDHTLLVAACATLMFVYHRKASYLIGLVALLVGLSRVAAGVHHLVDIIGSIIIAIIVTILVHLALKHQRLVRY
ncbi:TPA: hypothetical protein DEP96_03985 [Candidatus Uhrbacteria bacterium]|nr:hypothetical protein [Candidatus Uhrbacteria bacterium]